MDISRNGRPTVWALPRPPAAGWPRLQPDFRLTFYIHHPMNIRYWSESIPGILVGHAIFLSNCTDDNKLFLQGKLGQWWLTPWHHGLNYAPLASLCWFLTLIPTHHYVYYNLFFTIIKKISMSHILNRCHYYKGLYVSRHDRIVDIISKSWPSLLCVSMHMNCVVRQQMFSRCSAETSVFFNLNATRPDITIFVEKNINVFFLEVGWCFDSSLEDAYSTQLVKYHPLVQQISVLGYKCQYLVLIFSCLGHGHWVVIRGLRMVDFTKARAKQLAKYCSISSIIGSHHIWRRCCCVYP